MSNARQRPGRQTRNQLDDDKATRPTDLAESDGAAMEDELSASIHIISTGEERRQRHQGSGDDNGFSVSDRDYGSADGREGIDDDRTLQDEIRPKDGSSMGVSADVDVDADEDDVMPTGLPKKPGLEDYNPAARPHVRAGDSRPETPAGS